MGILVDFEKDTQVLLFSFSLPNGYVDGVRLFVNEKDPSSAQPGMLGGDFANVLIGTKGANYFRSSLGHAGLATVE